MDRLVDRIFAQAQTTVGSHLDAQDTSKVQECEAKNEEDEIRRSTASMSATDAIKRILLAEKDKDYFRMMELPQPELDALGRAAWNITPTEVSKAYRKLSILVHPDKNPGDEARQAFEALNQAHRMLKDPAQLEGILRDQTDKAKARREEAEGRATLEERVAMNAQQKEEARELRKSEGRALNEEILRQMKEKQERAKRRREVEARAQRRMHNEDDREDIFNTADADEQNDGDKETNGKHGESSDSENEAALRRRKAMARRNNKRRASHI